MRVPVQVSDLLTVLKESGKRVRETGQGRRTSEGRMRFLAQSQPLHDPSRNTGA